MGFPSPDFQTMDMLCKLVLCRDIRQFPPQNVVSAGMQRSAALWTAALLLRQFVQDLFYRKTGKIRFPRCFFLRQRTDASEDPSNAALREASSNRQSCSCSSALLSLEHP